MAGVILCSDSACSLNTVWLVRKGFADRTIRTTKQTTILILLATFLLNISLTHHRQRIRVGCRLRIPLSHHISRFACVGAVSSWRARLIWTHGPALVFQIRCNSNHQISIGEYTLSTTFLYSVLDVFGAWRCMQSLMLVSFAQNIQVRQLMAVLGLAVRRQKKYGRANCSLLNIQKLHRGYRYDPLVA